MRLTRTMMISVMQITGSDENALTRAGLTGDVAGKLIGAAKAGDYNKVLSTLERNHIPFLSAAALAERVAQKHKRAIERGEVPAGPFQGSAHPEETPNLDEFSVLPATTEEPTLEDGANPEDAIAAAVDMIREQAEVLNDRMRGRVHGALESIGAAMQEISSRPTAPPAYTAGEVSSEYLKPAWFNRAAGVLNAGLDLLLVGTAGTGKTRAGLELATAMGLKCGMHDFRADMRRADVLYSKELIDGETVVTLAPLLEEIQTECVSVINEPFTLDAEKFQAFNGLLESGQRSISTPLGVITRHPGHRFVLASNTSGRTESRQYRGPQAQDASALSRVVCLRVDIDPAVEAALAKSAGLNAVDAAWVIAQVRNLRGAVNRAQILYDVTPRQIQQIGALIVRSNWTREDAARDVLLGALEPSEVAKVSSALDFSVNA